MCVIPLLVVPVPAWVVVVTRTLESADRPLWTVIWSQFAISLHLPQIAEDG